MTFLKFNGACAAPASSQAFDIFFMVSATSEELINLLERHRDDALVSICLEQIMQADKVRLSAAGVLPLKQVIDIYSTRARINAKRSGRIKGYDTLLPALESADVSSIKLQSFELLDRHLVVFSDESISHLFGVLNCPKKKAAWFHPETGYD